MDRGIHIAEVPLVGRHLPVGVQIGGAEHQVHLLLGEVRVHDGEREGVEGQIPGRVPGILPLVGHGDDVLIQHVVPLRVPGIFVSGMERVGVVLVQPVVTVKEEELLAPEHAGDGLAHHPGRVFTHRWRRDRLVKLIGFTQAVSEEFIKLLTEGFVFNVWGTLGEAQANHFALTGAYIDPVVRRDLGALLDRKSTRLNSSHGYISYAVFCLKKKKKNTTPRQYSLNSPTTVLWSTWLSQTTPSSTTPSPANLAAPYCFPSLPSVRARQPR